ncbi:MAG TPA: Pycsar system effector family protein [Lacunisphaera sp.]
MKVNNPGNEINYLLQQTRVHHMQLSIMADLKANMLLTMASIVVTLAAPQVMKAGSQAPLLVLMGFSLVTILLAAYAVMPKMSFTGLHSPPDMNSPHFNLLFFGDFTCLTYEQFEAEMEKIMNSPSAVYEAQVREIYTLGTFLAQKKYRYLRLAYVTFISGLFASFITLLLTNKA